MGRNPFSIVDVFAEEKYAGNELAVVRQAESFSDAEMQKIAREMNFSETTFILKDEATRGGFDVRIFTPQSEMPFAGHPTLGTAFVIQQEILRQRAGEVVLNLKVGPIPVTFTYRGQDPDILWMKQIPPRFGQTIKPEQAAQVLGLKPADIDSRFPVQSVSTGVPFFIVPLKTLEALRSSRVNPRKLFVLINRTEAKAFLLFCPETTSPQNNLQVRVFADALGVPEDPATGSANGCLAGYLVKHRYFGGGAVDIRVEQGYEVGRPSLLLLKAAEEAGDVSVSVGGRVIPVARGELI
ncbi:MAG: phenazine biosynthesis protein [Candidatus Aminicenantes bacterium RBG_16_63_16]|nr:MAG: phenazine biosynthesis protein [Candidatus Aminicenantes bacterium RBG_16_63_16]